MGNTLIRYIEWQKWTEDMSSYKVALREIQSGKKESHWMWYIFPQLRWLGISEMSQYFWITDLEEAESYFWHNVLGSRLIQLTTIVLETKARTAIEIFWDIDAQKFQSSMTLFSQLDETSPIFKEALDKYFFWKYCEKTFRLLNLTTPPFSPSSHSPLPHG